VSAPRYVVNGPGAKLFEFPLQALTHTKPSAHLAVYADAFDQALAEALVWAEHFNVKQHVPLYPKVRYDHSSNPDRRMVKRIVGSVAWVENASHGAWIDIGRLSV
jgi:hypothetical protein